jgi:DNA-directed RNA polymerase subunit beta'
MDEVRMAYDHDELDLQASIKVRMAGEMVQTTTGRVLLYDVIPEGLPVQDRQPHHGQEAAR